MWAVKVTKRWRSMTTTYGGEVLAREAAVEAALNDRGAGVVLMRDRVPFEAVRLDVERRVIAFDPVH